MSDPDRRRWPWGRAAVLCGALAFFGCGDDHETPGRRDGAAGRDGVLAADGGGEADGASTSAGTLGSACDVAERDCTALSSELPGIATLTCHRKSGAKRGFCTFYCDIPPDPYPLRYGLVTLCENKRSECMRHAGHPRSVCTPPQHR